MQLAFFIGLLSSTHCVMMCGPLLWSLPLDGKAKWALFLKQFVYQLGRLLSYTLLGLLIGLLSSAEIFNGTSRYISLLSGFFLILMGGLALSSRYITCVGRWQQKLLLPFLKGMGYWLNKPGGTFMVGILNGFLPCGMVYMALALALNTGSAIMGARFMLLFGLGTLPLMLVAGILGHYFKARLKLRLSSWLPLLFLVMGLWFTLRGAHMDIPYLSPALQPATLGNMICK